MATSKVEICNRALQILGASSISSLTENSENARQCNLAYEPVKKAELRKHNWSFAIERASLAADATAPAFGRSNAFELPSDCLKVLSPYPEDNTNDRDWIIEKRKILTDESAPLQIRYIYDVTDPNQFDALFAESLAAKMALEMSEALTQSNSKKEFSANKHYKDAIREAKMANAIERVPQDGPEDKWITART